ncbi:hypothetical protein D3C78_1693660 [compost metagenome]
MLFLYQTAQQRIQRALRNGKSFPSVQQGYQLVAITRPGANKRQNAVFQNSSSDLGGPIWHIHVIAPSEGYVITQYFAIQGTEP